MSGRVGERVRHAEPPQECDPTKEKGARRPPKSCDRLKCGDYLIA